MPDPETMRAAKECLDAFIKLLQVLGPIWTLVYCGFFGGGVAWLLIWRAKQPDKAWERALQTKDQMIEQINEQNRELRVQALVVGKQFTKQEAARLVYGEDRLGNPALPKPKKTNPKKK
jgi:hypothetical protein